MRRSPPRRLASCDLLTVCCVFRGRGDSAITPRIFSFVAAACIPVFPFSLDYLPFQHLVPWRNISLSVEPCAVSRFRPNSSTPNPLEFLTTLPMARIGAMQRELLRVRDHLLFRVEPLGPSAVHSLALELSSLSYSPPGALLRARETVDDRADLPGGSARGWYRTTDVCEVTAET